MGYFDGEWSMTNMTNPASDNKVTTQSSPLLLGYQKQLATFDPDEGIWDAYIQQRNATIGAGASKRKQERFYKKFKKQWDAGEDLRRSEFEWNQSMQDMNNRLDIMQLNFKKGLGSIVSDTQNAINNRQLIETPKPAAPKPVVPTESAYVRAKREGNVRNLIVEDPLAAAAISAEELGITPVTRGFGKNEVSVNPDEVGYNPDQLVQSNVVKKTNNTNESKPGSWMRSAARVFEGATGLGKGLNNMFNTLAEWREDGWLQRDNSRKPIYLLPGRTTANMHKSGGNINKFSGGGTALSQKELQDAFMAYLMDDASRHGMEFEAYVLQLGEEGVKAKYKEFMQNMQGGVKAKLGAKLGYLNKLKGNCPEGYELIYMKEGGRVCPVCQKKAEKAQGGNKLEKKNEVQKFKEKRHVNPSDTVHVNGKPKSLTNSDGSRVDKRFPAYTNEDYKKDKNTKDGQKRRMKADLVSSEKCGGKAKKNK